ncbi:hypothetical protein Syun_006006 [Stephania yunnanensis]|uniref:Uncharacterized protein n=1 Tax=Stephania yunnanensis TaxID=152371 RepID=A0AAP0KWU6_9MAGN
MSSTSFENKKKSLFAKAASQGPSNRDDLLEIFGISNAEVLQTNYDIDQAIAAVRRLKDALPSDLVREELGILTSFIQQQRYRSVEELNDYIEQLFVEMLNELLIQLPNAIYKEIIECNPEDYEKVIRFSLKLLCKVESLASFVQWSYPIGTNINDLITNSSDESKMARHECVNGTLDDSSYSSPVPIIGLYIAAATLVCFFSMLFDIISGFRNRKRWLPCRFFSLNSVTLTLLAIAAKIPVDLTTDMPSALDQLSKLTGTTLICICMGFLMPSLGINGESESWINMLALSILVVTVVINICIQLYTGVIILFRVEHIIVLCCMMLLLLALLCATYDINCQKSLTVDQNKDLLNKGRGSMLERLKLCYVYAYHSNPQLELCKDLDSSFIGILCVVSPVVLVQAAFRCFIRKEMMSPCSRSSDYEWSMRIILGTQIATILIGSLGTSFRLVTLAPYMDFDSFGLNWAYKDLSVIDNNPLDTWAVYNICLMQVWPRSRSSECKSKERNMDEIREYMHLIHDGEQGLEEWTLRKSVEGMKKWMELNKKNVLNRNIKRLLSDSPQLEETLLHKLKDFANYNKAYEVSSHSMVLLVRIATVCVDSTRSGPLRTILSEIFEVAHFVERKMSSTSFENKKKSKLAKAAFEGPSSRNDLLKVFKISNDEALQSCYNVDRTIAIVKRLKDALPEDLVREELGILTSFIQHQNYRSVDELYGYIEQLFVNMLNEFLSQLPNAIYKEIIESNPEVYEEVIRFSLKLLCKVEALEPFVQWSYPIGTNINNLITDSLQTIALIM